MKSSRIVVACILSSFLFLSGAGASAQVITEFSAGISAGAQPSGITAGPDGNLWFTDGVIDRIGRITPDGVVTEFGAGITAGAQPFAITRGPDGNLWFTEYDGNRIGRISVDGVVTEFSAGITGTKLRAITAGPDGNLWFTESSHQCLGRSNVCRGLIGRITPAGVVTEFLSDLNLFDITAGPDGNLWFTLGSHQCFLSTDQCGGGIGRITPLGVITQVFITGGKGSITAGPDGNLWFIDGSNRIGRITPLGVVTYFSSGITAGAWLDSITAGPDGNLWFTEYGNVLNNGGGRIGSITPSGCVTEFSAGLSANANPIAITAGLDGNVWFTEGIGSIGRLVPSLHGQACSLTTLVSSLNPSHPGLAIVFTASVGGNFPTGTVQFMDGTNNLGAPITLSGGGIAQLMTSTLSKGTHAITAVYGGDSNNAPSASSVLLQQVEKVRGQGHHS